MIMNIRVLTPDRVISTSSADEVVLPGATGQVGVLDGHAGLLTMLQTGLLRIKLNGTWTPFILFGGVAQIKNDHVVILAKDIEELIDFELRKAANELEKIVIAFEELVTEKERIDIVEKLKKANARVQGIKYLSKKI